MSVKTLCILFVLLLASGAAWMAFTPRDKPVEAVQPSRPSPPGFAQGVTRALPDAAEMGLDAYKVALGRDLFSDLRLSADDTVACASCHVLAAGGSDNRVHSVGIHGAEGNINAPTVYNSAFNFVQFWDGRALTLEDQIDGPVQNPIEMGSDWGRVVDKLKQDKSYRRRFGHLYQDGISRRNIKDAIATFERSLVTPGSRFDLYLQGDTHALTEHEARGYELFQSYGCVACHQGMNLGGNMFERMGMMADYFGDRGHVTEADRGRYNVTGNEADRHYFRVPSLRNVARTAPYFHDGSAPTLADAVKVMAKYQLGRKMPGRDVDDIVAFLGTLNGELEGHAP